MGSTNYTDTFIQVAEDCPVASAEVPAPRGGRPTVASLQFDLLDEHPYEMTSDDLLFAVHAERQGIPEAEQPSAREAFFAKSQACLRASPLPKRHGWGVHHDSVGRIALVPLGSDRYAELAADPSVRQLKAMRTRRA